MPSVFTDMSSKREREGQEIERKRVREKRKIWQCNYRNSAFKRSGSEKVSDFTLTRSPYKDDFK